MDDFGFNPFDPATQREPFAAYARGRREFPVYAHEGFPVTSVFRYEDCLGILRDALETAGHADALQTIDKDMVDQDTAAIEKLLSKS